MTSSDTFDETWRTSGTPAALDSRGQDTVASVLRRHALAHAAEPFLAFESSPGVIEITTWAEMLARAERTAGALHRLGVSPGDRFGVHLANCPEFFDVWLGAALLGAAMVPSNPQSTPDELAYQFTNADCRLCITQPELRDVAIEAARDRLSVYSIDEAWVRSDDRPPSLEPTPSDVLGVLYTSGTTSHPKGVLITQAAYLHVGDAIAEHVRLQPIDRMMIVLPMFHGNAQYYSSMSAIVTGASIALTPRFSASRWSQQATLLSATVASLFAAPMRMILAQEPSGFDRLHNLRLGLFAQNLTDDQLAAFEARFGLPMAQLYGMTETIAPPTINPIFGERRGSSIGRPIRSARLRIIDEEGADVPVGDAGELLVAGEPGRTLMLGYLGNPEATASALRNGWLHTGDSVRADSDGYLYFVDRRKDMIKRAGENIATGEVERVLNEHPAVFEAAAFGIPDPMRDEALLAAVVLRDGAQASSDELFEHCRSHLARFKIPDSIIVVPSLPKTAVGKVQKHILRQTIAPRSEADSTVNVKKAT